MQRKLLIVDDEELALNAMLTVLEPWAADKGIVLVGAASAEQALAILEKDSASIPVVLSDLRMPGMMGSDLLGEVRRLYPDIVTMLATGFPEAGEISKAVGAGIFSFILKPWSLGYLEGELGKALKYQALQEDNRRYLKMLEDELRWGGAFQRALLKIDHPLDEAVSFESAYVPLEQLHCGGDFYDLIALGSRQYVCLIGDVAGHGIKAAFVTAALKAMIREVFSGEPPPSPAWLLRWLNRRVCDILPDLPDLLVTFSACFLRADPWRLEYANAGHPAPYIVRSGGAQRLDLPGPGLGFGAEARYEQLAFALEPGDRLLLYTDGLVELERGVGAVDESSFRGELIAAAGEPDFTTRLIERMRRLAPHNRFIDDVAVLSALLHKPGDGTATRPEAAAAQA